MYVCVLYNYVIYTEFLTHHWVLVYQQVRHPVYIRTCVYVCKYICVCIHVDIDVCVCKCYMYV